MSDSKADFSISTLSLSSTNSHNEDWDHSESDIQAGNSSSHAKQTATPRNSVVFPANGAEKTPVRGAESKGERTLSELLKMHSEKGTEGGFSVDEASRVAEVLGQWINSESSPYEAEDDFFTRSQDDSSLSVKRSSSSPLDASGRPRGQSESTVNSRLTLVADGVKI